MTLQYTCFMKWASLFFINALLFFSYDFFNKKKQSFLSTKSDISVCFHRVSQSFSNFHISEVSVYKDPSFFKRTEECYLSMGHFFKNTQNSFQNLLLNVYDFHKSFEESSLVQEIYSLFENIEKNSDNLFFFIEKEEKTIQKRISYIQLFFYIEFFVLASFLLFYLGKNNFFKKKSFEEQKNLFSLKDVLTKTLKQDSFVEWDIEESLYISRSLDSMKDIFYLSKEVIKEDYQDLHKVKITAKQILNQTSIYFESTNNQLIQDIVNKKKESVNYNILEQIIKEKDLKLDVYFHKENNQTFCKLALRMNNS